MLKHLNFSLFSFHVVSLTPFWLSLLIIIQTVLVLLFP